MRVSKIQQAYGVTNLDYRETLAQLTLREVIMGIRSVAMPERQIFTTVHAVKECSMITLSFNKDFEKEAKSLVPGLAVYCIAKVGNEAMEWFRDKALAVLQDYRWEEG